MREWRHIDKTAWGPGPWVDEPDKIQWVDPVTDLDCLMVRHERYGHWCGYVGVPPGHPAHGKGYSSVEVEVHGGLTFADRCDETAPEGHGICHVPGPGRPADVWWLGFDCGHAWDHQPGLAARLRSIDLPDAGLPRGVYRDRAWVASECAHLAVQLRAAQDTIA
jgi:hypothetical protein